MWIFPQRFIYYSDWLIDWILSKAHIKTPACGGSNVSTTACRHNIVRHHLPSVSFVHSYPNPANTPLFYTRQSVLLLFYNWAFHIGPNNTATTAPSPQSVIDRPTTQQYQASRVLHSLLLFLSHSAIRHSTQAPSLLLLSLIHIWRCRRLVECRSRWSPYH